MQFQKPFGPVSAVVAVAAVLVFDIFEISVLRFPNILSYINVKKDSRQVAVTVCCNHSTGRTCRPCKRSVYVTPAPLLARVTNRLGAISTNFLKLKLWGARCFALGLVGIFDIIFAVTRTATARPSCSLCMKDCLPLPQHRHFFRRASETHTQQRPQPPPAAHTKKDSYSPSLSPSSQ